MMKSISREYSEVYRKEIAMKLKDIYGVVNEDTNIRVYSGNYDVPIAEWDGTESIPNFLNEEDVWFIQPKPNLIEVVLEAYTKDLVASALKKHLAERLDDLNNGEDVGNILLNIEEFIDSIEEFRGANL